MFSVVVAQAIMVKPEGPNYLYLAKQRKDPAATNKVAPEVDDSRDIFLKRPSYEFVEDSDLNLGKQYAAKFIRVLRPIRYWLTASGQLPVISVKNPDGTSHFEHSWKNIFSIWFYVTTLILFVFVCLYLLNVGGILLNSPPQQPYSYVLKGERINKSKDRMKAEEDYVFARNIVPVITIAWLLLHCFVGNFYFFYRRHFIASYFSFWVE